MKPPSIKCPCCGARLSLEPWAPVSRAWTDWAAIDWAQPNHIIARALGVTHEAVSKQRKKHGGAPQLRPRKSQPKGIAWSAVDWSQSTKAIAEAMRVTPSTVSVQRRRWAPETLRVKFSPLPNTELRNGDGIAAGGTINGDAPTV